MIFEYISFNFFSLLFIIRYLSQYPCLPFYISPSSVSWSHPSPYPLILHFISFFASLPILSHPLTYLHLSTFFNYIPFSISHRPTPYSGYTQSPDVLESYLTYMASLIRKTKCFFRLDSDHLGQIFEIGLLNSFPLSFNHAINHAYNCNIFLLFKFAWIVCFSVNILFSKIL